MEDETTEELTSDSEYSDSFIATDDDMEEELTWDSEDSRPPGPSPHSDPWESPAQVLRNRRIRRRRVVVLPDSTSENSLQIEISSSSSPVGNVELQDTTSRESDSDETYMSEQPQSPLSSPRLMASPSPNSPDSPVSQGNGFIPRSPDYSPPQSPRVPDPFPIPQSPQLSEPHFVNRSPRSPDYPPRGESPQILEPHSPEPEIIEITSPVQPPNPPEQNSTTVSVSKPAPVIEKAQLDSSTLSEGEDASLCTICMCPLTNSGTHRVVCLRCGHIFGQSCVERWIKVGCNNGARRCPTCNKKACLKDIRVLYLPKVVPLDTSERDRLLQEKEELAAQKKMLESDFTRTVLQHKLVVAQYEERLQALEERLQEGHSSQNNVAHGNKILNANPAVVSSVSISHDGGCRVMAFNSVRQELVVSRPSGNTSFAGFGVRVVNSVDWRPSRYVVLHTKAVRDLQFHPEDRDLLLSASLDQNAKLYDVATNTIVHTFKGESPLWSCCWDVSYPHLLLLGSQSGKVYQYDRRMTGHHINVWETDNKTPVVALASTPCRANTPFPQGGFLSCRLNTVYSYVRHGEKYGCKELAVDGPFMSMRYDGTTQMMLTTSRPSSRSPHTRVCLNLLDCDTSGKVFAPLIHSFNCGSSARVMSRSTTLSHMDDSIVVSHNESGRTLEMWSSKSGEHVRSIPVREPVIDLMPVALGSSKPPLLAALSEKNLTLYRI